MSLGSHDSEKVAGRVLRVSPVVDDSSGTVKITVELGRGPLSPAVPTPASAILEGCRERLRPILMTAATTIVGLIPLAWGDGGLFDMKYFPMARTVMGGLMASTALTLIVLPTYYTLFDDLAVWVKRTWFASDPSRLEPTTEAAGD